MFDAEYFEKHFFAQVKELGSGACSGEVHLHGGAFFSVRSVCSVTAGYVLLEIYPNEGVTDDSKAARRKPGGTDEVFFDRVAVSYSTISHVLLTVKEPERRGVIGFK